jgi:hypothetical protein
MKLLPIEMSEYTPLDVWIGHNRLMHRMMDQLESVFQPVLAGELRRLPLRDQDWAEELIAMTDQTLAAIDEIRTNPILADCNIPDVAAAAGETQTLTTRREHLRQSVANAVVK